jgi:hypothetical protein
MRYGRFFVPVSVSIIHFKIRSSTITSVAHVQHPIEPAAPQGRVAATGFPAWRLPAGLGHHGPPPLRQAQLSLAQPAETGHRGQVQLTQKREGKTVTQTLSSPAAMRKAGKEIAAFRRFQALTHDLVEVNQKICRLRLIERQEQTASRKKTVQAIQQEVIRKLRMSGSCKVEMSVFMAWRPTASATGSINRTPPILEDRSVRSRRPSEGIQRLVLALWFDPAFSDHH